MKKKKAKTKPQRAKSKHKKKITPSSKSKSESFTWREFEKLVTRIEQVYSPQGAVVTSPDYLIDNITNEKREVDATIKYKIDSVEKIIVIECRDRTKIQDVLWIEQLVTKLKDIGATKIIAVASKGFYKPAIKKAKYYGIEVRQINKIDYESIATWTRVIRTQYNYQIVDKKILIDISENLKERFIAELKELKPSVLDAKLIVSYRTGDLFSIRNIFESDLNTVKEKIGLEEVPQVGHSGIYKYEKRLPVKECYFKTSFGNFDLSGLYIDYTLYKEGELSMKAVSAYTYTDTEEDLVKGKEFEIITNKGEKELLTIHHNLKEGKTSLTIWKDKMIDKTKKKIVNKNRKNKKDL